jgi:hypothetical protein
MKRRPIVDKAKSVALSTMQNFYAEKRAFAAETAGHSNLHTKIALAIIGCLLALNLMLRFPELGAVIAQYNQF